MSYDEKKTVESDAVAVNNMGGHTLASPNSPSGNIVEKRTVPLLYVQSPTNKPKNGDGNESSACKTLPKFATPVNVSSVTNGITTGAKLVQVQNPNQNIAYVGTLFKQSNKGKDMMPQKVLLTPVKGKEVSMARLILPRPPTIPAPQGGFQVGSKKICRSFVVSQVSQKTLIKAPGESAAAKIIQPNIIRQRGVGVDAKILTNAVLKPATVGLSGPLAIVKKPLIQNQTGDKGPLKVILVDMKEDANKPDVRNNEVTASKNTKTSTVDEKCSSEKNISDESPVENDSEKTVETESNLVKPTSIKSDNEKVSGGESKKMAGQWEDKESVASPSQATGDRARKRKGSLLSSASGPPKKVFIGDPYDNVKLFPGAEQYDPFKVIEWDSHGIGTVPNTCIKVIRNEFDMLELHESTDARVLDKMKSNNDEIYCCLACGCYGLISEFYNENYCGVNCRDNLIAVQHSIFKKDEKEGNVETNDKKKICDNIKVKTGPIPMPMPMPMVLPADESSSDKTTSTIQGGIESSSPKPNVSEVINLIDDCSSPESEPSPKKPDQSYDEPPRNPKLKKLFTKEHKSNRKLDVLKPVGQSPDNAKSKIKLRLRGSGKINKSSSTEDFVAQDMDMGWPNLDNESPKKKEISIFRWSTYLTESKSSGAWVKLFSNPFPSKPNRFKVGHRLEAIDPEHQSIICLVSIAQVKGYRLKLHFDGYPKEYDFWVNADSFNLFPSGFCNKLKIPLQPPPGHNLKTFDWDIYLSRHNAKGAHQSCFEHHAASDQVNLFKVDMKLEAIDRKNTYLVCVATVAAVMENRILVHFDSWDDMYDFWVDISSPYIRPVGWCKTASHQLTPPNGIKVEDFNWKKYLKDTRSVAAPEKAFVLRPPIEFKKGMKVEAVDKRAPHLIRVATISEVLPYQVKITFDGLPAHFGYWVDDDSPDIHPVGWSSRAGHPLEPPPSLDDFTESTCPTPGCIGQGYYQGTRKETHGNVKNCPYTTENLGKDSVLTDRLKWSSKPFRRNSDDVVSLTEDSADESENEPEELKWAWMSMKQNIHKRAKREKGRDDNLNLSTAGESSMEVDQQPPEELPEVKVEGKDILGRKKEMTVVVEQACGSPNKEYTLKEKTNDASVKSKKDYSSSTKADKKEDSLKKRHCRSEVDPPVDEKGTGTIPIKAEPPSDDVYMCDSASATSIASSSEDVFTENNLPDRKNPLYWTIHQVAKFTKPLLSSSNDRFSEEGIDGEGLMMMSKRDLLEILGLSVSEAERIYTNVNMLKLKQKAV